MSLPEPLNQEFDTLREIVKKHPVTIPVDVAANYLGRDVTWLRNTMKNSTCPFGFGHNENGNWSFCIKTLKFYLWIVNGNCA